MDREQKELPSDLDLVKNKKLKTHHRVLQYTEKDQKVFLISHLLEAYFAHISFIWDVGLIVVTIQTGIKSHTPCRFL